jgi:hypothetical protein
MNVFWWLMTSNPEQAFLLGVIVTFIIFAIADNTRKLFKQLHGHFDKRNGTFKDGEGI